MFLLIDIGGTHTRIATSQDNQTLSEPVIYHTPQAYLEGLNNLKSQISNLKNIDQVCCGIAGSLNSDKSVLIQAPHLLNYVDKPLKHNLEEIFRCGAVLENDAALGGLGEAHFGSGRGYNIIGFLTIGTGVGGVRIVDRQIDHNSLGFEPGKMIVDGVHTLEDLVSGWALEKKYGIKSGDIFDPEVWTEVTRVVSIGINNLIVEWSPELIILGGSLSQKLDLSQINLQLKKLQPFPKLPALKRAQLGQASTLYGGLEYISSE